MSITDVVGLVAVVHLHDPKGLGNLLRITFLRATLVVNLNIKVIRRVSRARAAVPCDSRQGRRRTSRLRAVGHQRQHQTLQSVDAVLHIIGCGRRLLGRVFLARIGLRIGTRRSVAALDAVLTGVGTVAFQPGPPLVRSTNRVSHGTHLR